MPAIPLVVPHAKAFASLHAFLVMHRLDWLMCGLLPVSRSMLSSTRAGTSAANTLECGRTSSP